MCTRFIVIIIILALCLTGCRKGTEFSAGEFHQAETESLNEPFAFQENSENDAADEIESTAQGMTNEKNDDTYANDLENTNIFVYVCGAVVNPGVYELRGDARICDALLLAGGMTKEADVNQINQAQRMEDGQKIYVPVIGELVSQVQETVETTAGTDGKTGNENDSFVNINTADETILMTLPGIGSTRAADIIKYREENGKFKTIDELMNVPGIKSGIYDKLKDMIIVS